MIERDLVRKEDFELIERKFVPKSAFERLGCLFCEWRSKKHCPNLVNEQTKIPSGGICERRRAWIYSLTRDYDSQPTFDTWLLDFNKAIGQSRMLKEMELEAEWNEQADIAEKQGETDLAERMRQKASKARNMWSKFWKDMVEYGDRQVSRETPRKRELDVRVQTKVTPSDVAELIRRANEKVVEAEVINGTGNGDS